MTDFFALLGEPRRPWLDPERIRETFHRLSRDQHPDAAGGDAGDFTELNAAQAALGDPRARLRHLLALEFPDVPTSAPAAVPAALGELVFPVQGFLQTLDAFLSRRAAAPGALGRALLAGGALALQEEALGRLADLEGRQAALLAEVRALDARWDPRAPGAAGELLELYQGLGYLDRWTGQLRERVFRLDVEA